MIVKLIECYESGGITANHLIVEAVRHLDPRDPASSLQHLSKDFQRRLLDFVEQFQSSRMLSNGPLPTAEQVEAARRWVQESLNAAA